MFARKMTSRFPTIHSFRQRRRGSWCPPWVVSLKLQDGVANTSSNNEILWNWVQSKRLLYLKQNTQSTVARSRWWLVQSCVRIRLRYNVRKEISTFQEMNSHVGACAIAGAWLWKSACHRGDGTACQFRFRVVVNLEGASTHPEQGVGLWKSVWLSVLSASCVSHQTWCRVWA